MRKNLTFLFLLFSINFTFCQNVFFAKVVGIKDGDTVVVLDSLNQQTTLRLAEVDCPENSQPFGNKAKQFTSQEIYRKQIKYVVTDMDR